MAVFEAGEEDVGDAEQFGGEALFVLTIGDDLGSWGSNMGVYLSSLNCGGARVQIVMIWRLTVMESSFRA
jgi:hypothetical protein